jgi:hypothetical protein
MILTNSPGVFAMPRGCAFPSARLIFSIAGGFVSVERFVCVMKLRNSELARLTRPVGAAALSA